MKQNSPIHSIYPKDNYAIGAHTHFYRKNKENHSKYPK
jgi:hypothetical protein